MHEVSPNREGGQPYYMIFLLISATEWHIFKVKIIDQKLARLYSLIGDISAYY